MGYTKNEDPNMVYTSATWCICRSNERPMWLMYGSVGDGHVIGAQGHQLKNVDKLLRNAPPFNYGSPWIWIWTWKHGLGHSIRHRKRLLPV